jgi:thermitase
MKRPKTAYGLLAGVGLAVLSIFIISGTGWFNTGWEVNENGGSLTAAGPQFLKDPEIINPDSGQDYSSQPAPGDPYLDKQWVLGQIGATELPHLTTTGSDIIIAILDTGIDRNHEDLENKVVAEINFSESPSAADFNGHGTHIAGIMAATGNNGLGIIGLAPQSRLMNVKAANDDGTVSTAAVTQGIIWAVDHGARVININVSFKSPAPSLEAAVNYAWSRGAVLVAAAGNEDSEAPCYPAGFQNCIAVAALCEDGSLAPFSNHGENIDLAAPGFNIFSTLPGNKYGYKSGTSFAAAYVSGLAAWLFSSVTDTNENGLVNDEVKAAIESGCQSIDTEGTGKGRISFSRSLRGILN